VALHAPPRQAADTDRPAERCKEARRSGEGDDTGGSDTAPMGNDKGEWGAAADATSQGIMAPFVAWHVRPLLQRRPESATRAWSLLSATADPTAHGSLVGSLSYYCRAVWS
jgi:hypothetical protein